MHRETSPLSLPQGFGNPYNDFWTWPGPSNEPLSPLNSDCDFDFDKSESELLNNNNAASPPSDTNLITSPQVPVHPTVPELGDLQPPVRPAIALSYHPRFDLRKPNKIPKGKGNDAAPDPAGGDDYRYQNGYHFNKLKPFIHKRHAEAIKFICQAIHQYNPPGLRPKNRCVTKRMRCAYKWLDKNRDCISDELLNQCLLDWEKWKAIREGRR
jgi:hypothetical protein